jgi:hypothetical protein
VDFSLENVVKESYSSGSSDEDEAEEDEGEGEGEEVKDPVSRKKRGLKILSVRV